MLLRIIFVYLSVFLVVLISSCSQLIFCSCIKLCICNIYTHVYTYTCVCVCVCVCNHSFLTIGMSFFGIQILYYLHFWCLFWLPTFSQYYFFLSVFKLSFPLMLKASICWNSILVIIYAWDISCMNDCTCVVCVCYRQWKSYNIGSQVTVRTNQWQKLLKEFIFLYKELSLW